MGFFSNGPKDRTAAPSIDLMHRLECRICPLNRLTINQNPHMKAAGPKKPLIYILGDAPGAAEDRHNEHFCGDAGDLLRPRISKKWLPQIRWNNVVRTRPPKNRPPETIEIECCRPSVERDIAQSKPKAIFGFGAVPLLWAMPGAGTISDWRGRRFPVNIGGHECWFYPMLQPSYLYRLKQGKNMRATDIGSEDERAFVLDLKKALAEVEDLEDAVVHDEAVALFGVETIDGSKSNDLDRLEKLLTWAGKQEAAGVDYETNRKRPYDGDAKVLTAAVGTDELSFSFVLDHPQAKWTKEQKKTVRKLWKKFLRSPCLKVVHHLSFEHEWTAVMFGKGFLRASPWGCSLLQASTIDERTGSTTDSEGKIKRQKKKKGGPLSLEFLVKQYFGFNLKHLTNLDRARLEFEKLSEVLTYNAMDAKYHFLLFMLQRKIIERDGLEEQYAQGLRRIPTCVMTQVKGVPVSHKVVRKLKKKWNHQTKRAQKEVAASDEAEQFRKVYKKEYDPESSHDNLKMFRDMLQCPEGFREDYSGKRRYTVEEETLQAIASPLSMAILRMRKASKKASTYLYDDTWPDGLLHSIFNPGFFTETFRISSEDPNLQNMPKRDKDAKIVRSQLVAPPGHLFFAADYGQIEARVIAMISKDKNFVRSLWERYDVHGHWAERLARCYPERIGGKSELKNAGVMKDFRNDVKNQWTFPLFFGAQLSSVAEYLEIPETDLQPEFKEFKREFRGVFDWQEELLESYRQTGYVEMLTGRRRRAPLSRNQVLNSPVQGTAAEIVMDGMIRLSEYADEIDDDYFQPNINIHDDLTFILPEKGIEDYAEKIISEMVKVNFPFVNVPITIEGSIGRSMAKMEEVIKASSDDWKIAA